MKKNRFDNQVTIIYKNDKYMPNVKIFKNGNIQITGIKIVEDTEIIVNHIIDNIKNIYNNISNDIINNRDENYKLKLKYQNFKIRMINSDFKVYCEESLTVPFGLKRREIHKIFICELYNNKCSFQPGIYQGVKLEYFWNKCNDKKNGICYCPKKCYGKGKGENIGDCKKVTGALFESGSILITGGVSFEQVDEVYKYICDFLIKHKNNIKKIDLLKLNIEGSEYDVLEKLLNDGKIDIIENIQVQFHTFIDNCVDRRNNIREKLKNTHIETYCYEFVWENWKKK